MKRLLIVTETRYLGDIDETKQVQDLIISDGSMLEVSKTETGFKITNGMNGYGHNIKADYEDAKIYTIDYHNK
jgi:hypothetical protein